MQSRLPRFKRATSIAAMRLTERDHEIIRLVHRHRFLRSSHICSLISGSRQQLLRRLNLLYHHGYLERPRAQLDYYDRGGSHHIVYGLGDKGTSLLKLEPGIAFRRHDWGEKNRSVQRVFLEHALLVSDVMVSIELACRQNGVRLLTESELATVDRTTGEHQPFRWKVNVTNRLKLGVIPDQVFGLEFSGAGARTERAYFFLEADRGTMPVIRKNLSQTSFYRKLLVYEATWSQSVHQMQFGFHRFRVLAVTTSAARVKSLVEACSKLKRGRGLFLFADKTILEKPGDVFSPVWRAGSQGETVSLLD